MGDAHLDGNAAGGLLHDLFGREMTDGRGCCDRCGTVGAMGSLVLYRAAGEVLCCPVCGAVVMVAVPDPDGIRVSLVALRWVQVPPG